MIEGDIGGAYLRVVEPDWSEPLDATFAEDHGGRWNAPGSYPVLYLNADPQTARANVRAKFAGLPYGPEDLDPLDGPHLVEVTVPHGRVCECRTEDGLVAVGLPIVYPLTGDGDVIGWEVCQAIGRSAHDRALDGVACRSAAPGGHEELAWFPRPDRPKATPERRLEFPDWYWSGGVVELEAEPDHLAIRPLREREEPEVDEHGLLVLDIGRAVTAEEVAAAIHEGRDRRG